MSTRTGRVTGLVLAVGVTAVLAGCTAQRVSTESGTAGVSGAEAKQVAPGAAPVGSDGQKREPAVSAGQERKLVRTAKLALATTDVKGAVDKAQQIAVGAGGYTGAEHTDAGSATLTLSVPADKVDAVLGQLTTSGLGNVTSREQSAQDVTEQSVDIESRLATQRASVERMRALLAKASSVSEVAAVERELTTRESELESLQRRRDALAGSVALSTVTVTVSAVVTPAAQVSSGGFVGGLAGGWHAFGVVGGGALTVLGALAPFLVVLGVPVFAVFWWVRRRRPTAEPAQPVE